MNLYQRLTITLAAIAVAAITLFPPWLYVYQHPRFPRMEHPAGYHAIWKSQVPTDTTEVRRLFVYGTNQELFTTMRINTTQLGIQVLGVLILTGLVYFALRGIQRGS